MKQKYTILRDVQNHRLIVREYAELDKEVLSLLCEETYADQVIESFIKSGKASLIKTLRTKNLYPPVIYADKIADAVIALYGSSDRESVDLIFDDIELLNGEPVPEAAAEDIEEDSSNLDELIEDDFSDALADGNKLRKLDSSLKIADDDYVNSGDNK